MESRTLKITLYLKTINTSWAMPVFVKKNVFKSISERYKCTPFMNLRIKKQIYDFISTLLLTDLMFGDRIEIRKLKFMQKRKKSDVSSVNFIS